jgi:FtsP/CotA-like multicopper oxidase with cupredoxin domain
MGRDQSFGMKEMSRSNRHKPEEQVGLLHAPADDDRWRGSEDLENDLEPRWSEKHEIPHHDQNHSPWMRPIAVVFLLICTVIVLVHRGLTSSQHDPSPSNSSGLARLRPEEDYILSSMWDFNAPPTTREYTWIVSDHILNPDGVYRPMILINGTFPGPLIECNEGDEIVVHVQNKATNATSIHWHGLYQNGTNWMDGTVGVTQCPIAPGHSFTYRFNVSRQTGTYWYHSHVSMQASDGLVGPLIIHARDGKEKEELQKVPYEQDRIVLVSDYYYDLSSDLLMQYLSPGSENDEPVPPSALINGRNMRDCTDLPNRNCTSSSISNALFNLSRTSNTRLRIINVGAFAEFALQIDEHEFQVTEVDGTDVHPQSIHRLNINPAQRYSIVITPPNEEKNQGLYWMRARMVTHCFAYEEPELQEEVRAVIHYPTAGDRMKDLIPTSKDWPEIIDVECRDLNTSNLEPVMAVPAPGIDPNHTLYLRSSFQIRDWRLSRGYLNDSSFRINATSPILNTMLSTQTPGANAHEGISNTGSFDPVHQLVYQTQPIRTITILIQNLDDGNHPFHLHGYKFFVLAQGHGYPPSTLLDPDHVGRHLNLTNPLRRDTASVEAYGWLLISFVADNPGLWIFHCHDMWHTEAGLAMVFATRVEEMGGWELPGDVEGLCGVEGVERGMGPDDGIWVGRRDEDRRDEVNVML